MALQKPLPEFINGFKVIEDLGKYKKTKYRYLLVECKICSRHFIAQFSLLPKYKSCGCKSGVFKDLPKEINGFKVIKDLGDLGTKGKRRYLIAICKVCGREFKTERESLKAKSRKGCGCRLKFDISKGYQRTNIPPRLRAIYSGMMSRCYNENHMTYHNYGAKGIIVCDLWKNNNKEFFKWALENGYNDNLTLDRINSDLGYFPENCRFLTMKENIQNRKSVTKLNPEVIRKIRNDCEIMTTREVAKKYGISHSHLIGIKLRRHWSNVE